MNVTHDKTVVLGQLGWYEGGCEALTMLRGRCAESDLELAVSDRTATALGVEVGERVVLPELVAEPVQAGTGEPFPQRYRVVGIYQRPRPGLPRWVGSGAFDFVPPNLSARNPLPARVDVVLSTQSLLTRLGQTPLRAQVRRTMVLDEPRADEVDVVEGLLATWAGELRSSNGLVEVDTPVLTTLTGLADERSAVRLASYLFGLQLLFLVWYVLFLITASSSDARSNDVALAKLRGLRTRRVCALGVGEPLILVLAAVPLGLAAAVLMARLAASALLSPDTTLRAGGDLALSILVALAGACVAAGLGVVRAVREPVLDQLRRAVPATSMRRVLVVEVVVVSLAVAALWQVGEPGAGLSGLALAAPGLGALAVAVVVGRLLSAGSVSWARRTRYRSSLTGFLASRQIGRRAGGTRVAVLVTVAASLAAFAGCTWQLADRQRDGQAAMEVGAAAVYRVETTTVPALMLAVEAADPTGKSLAAAVQVPGVGSSRPVLAVDSARLAAVSSWRTEWASVPVEDVAERLRPPTASSLLLRGTELTLTVDGRLSRGSPFVGVVARVADADGVEEAIPFGPMTFGREVLDAEAPQCAKGCRLTSVGLVRLPGELGALFGSTDFVALTVDGTAVPEAFDGAGGWRPARINEDLPTSSELATVAQAPQGVRMTFKNQPSLSPGMVRADTPAELPIVAGGAATFEEVGRDDLVRARGLDGGVVQAREVGRTTVLPRLGPDGALSDLTLAGRFGANTSPDAVFQVWAGDGAPGRTAVVEALEGAGLVVTGVTDRSRRADDLARRGPALALLLLIGVAGAGLVVAALAVVATALSQARRRAFELAALRTAGVSDDALRSATAREYAAQLGVGSVCGILSGVGTAMLAGPAVAVLGLSGALAPGDDALPWQGLVVVSAVAVVVFGVTTAVCARLGLAFARPDLLREAAA